MKKEKITFASVLRTGKEYSPDHVIRLYEMIIKNYSYDFEFISLSDAPIKNIHVIPLLNDWKGWWSKLELFTHDWGKTVYFDLDVDIKSSLDWMADLDPENLLIGYRCPIYREWSFLNSSVMMWKGPKPKILEGYSSKVNPYWKSWPKRYGDQGWIQRKLGSDLSFFPHQNIARWGIDHIEKEEYASIIVYGGKHRPWKKN